jgi:hypothetical protein
LGTYYTPANYRKPEFTVLNVVNSRAVVIGWVRNGRYIPDTSIDVIWPGGTVEIPKNDKASIPTSYARDPHNFDGNYA